MTAILNDIRRLDEQLARGDLTQDEYRSKREALLTSVEDAQTDFTPSRPSRMTRTEIPRRDTPASRTGNAFGLSLAICFGVMTLSIGFILLFLPDLNLALTVGVTILAALSVALLRNIED